MAGEINLAWRLVWHVSHDVGMWVASCRVTPLRTCVNTVCTCCYYMPTYEDAIRRRERKQKAQRDSPKAHAKRRANDEGRGGGHDHE